MAAAVKEGVRWRSSLLIRPIVQLDTGREISDQFTLTAPAGRGSVQIFARIVNYYHEEVLFPAPPLNALLLRRL